MKRTLTAIVAATGAMGVAATPALAASGITWQDASQTKEEAIQGLVTGVNAGTETFTVDAEAGSVIVNVGQLADNPLDEQGRVQIEQGDTVSVEGLMGRDVANQWVVEASTVSLLLDDTTPAAN